MPFLSYGSYPLPEVFVLGHSLTWFRQRHIKSDTTADSHNGVYPNILVRKFPLHPYKVVDSPPWITLDAVPPAFTRDQQHQHMSPGTWYLCEAHTNISTQTETPPTYMQWPTQNISLSPSQYQQHWLDITLNTKKQKHSSTRYPYGRCWHYTTTMQDKTIL